MDILFLLANNFKCIGKTCQCDDRSTMLVIMEDRNITFFFQFLFNFETSRCGNIFQVYSTKGTGDHIDCIYNFVHIVAFNAEWKCIYITKCLEKDTFTFHNRHSGFWSNVSKSKNSRTVCNYQTHVPSSCEFVRFVYILLDFQTRLCNSRCISK